MKILTTITPYWNRPEMLRVWLAAIKGATVPEVNHLIYFVGELVPEWWFAEAPANVRAISLLNKTDLSIGYYHNLGARAVDSEWIMKLDVDTLPNVNYFSHLLNILSTAPARAWFNGGMLYINKSCTEQVLVEKNMPIGTRPYRWMMENRSLHPFAGYGLPAGTNFICRRKEYLELGGCDERFRGYGWEDYQQIYMLEQNYIQSCPLPGEITMFNVTHRCRDVISRRKALELWNADPWLCLIHRWHPPSTNPEYKTKERMDANRLVLFNWITSHKSFYTI